MFGGQCWLDVLARKRDPVPVVRRRDLRGIAEQRSIEPTQISEEILRYGLAVFIGRVTACTVRSEPAAWVAVRFRFAPSATRSRNSACNRLVVRVLPSTRSSRRSESGEHDLQLSSRAREPLSHATAQTLRALHCSATLRPSGRPLLQPVHRGRGDRDPYRGHWFPRGVDRHRGQRVLVQVDPDSDHAQLFFASVVIPRRAPRASGRSMSPDSHITGGRRPAACYMNSQPAKAAKEHPSQPTIALGTLWVADPVA